MILSNDHYAYLSAFHVRWHINDDNMAWHVAWNVYEAHLGYALFCKEKKTANDALLNKAWRRAYFSLV